MNDTATISIKANIMMFSLAPGVRQDGPVVKMLREYIKTRQASILRHLLATKQVLGFKEKHNIVVTAGRTVFARRLAGDTTYTGEIDYGALGNGVSPSFTNASTQLASEVFRKQAAAQTYDGNIAYIDWFIATGDVANQTFTEFGSFIDGTGTANSGQAFSLMATGGWVKSGSMFISAKYTIS